MPHAVLLPPPAEGEYSPYYGRYVARVAAGDLLAQMAAQLGEVHALLAHLTDDEARARYAPGKWSVKESLGHVVDTERVFAYRALRIARGDATPLPGFDQDAFMRHAHFDTRPLASLLEEWELVRRSTLAFFRALPEEAFDRRGTASDAPVTVRALAYIATGHVAHHLALFREQYGLG
jgi:uncharacterized damage-inducible protein DinB